MKNKKLFIILALVISMTSFSYSMSCYSEWLDAFEDAEDIYLSNQSQCDGVLFGWALCHHENELIFDGAIEDAGDEFYCCVEGC